VLDPADGATSIEMTDESLLSPKPLDVVTLRTRRIGGQGREYSAIAGQYLAWFRPLACGYVVYMAPSEIGTFSNGPATADRRARNRAWVKRHPLKFVVIFVALAALDLWLRLGIVRGQHTSAVQFLLYLALALAIGLTFAAIQIHRRNGRAS
jgi:hypothetical protein